MFLYLSLKVCSIKLGNALQCCLLLLHDNDRVEDFVVIWLVSIYLVVWIIFSKDYVNDINNEVDNDVY